jgi:RND family efflux transporter MFP subunit
VDLDERLRAQEAAVRRAQASLQEVQARQQHAQVQAQRYRELLAARSTSEEMAATRQQDLLVANAALEAARAEAERLRAEQAALRAQRSSLRLVAPAAGRVTARQVEPGSAVAPGQTVAELVDPSSLWVHVRFDQGSASGLAAGQPARVVLRSAGAKALPGRVLRVEPLADAVTEETLAKVVFGDWPTPLPPLGELAEVTVGLPEVAAAPAIPNAALRRVDGQVGVWQLDGEGLRFVPVRPGAADLDGHVQVREGLKGGERIVVYSEKALNARSTPKVVERLAGAAR